MVPVTADVAIITAIYDSYDELKPIVPQDGVEVDWILVTDAPPPVIPDCGWRVISQPRPGVHPNRAAKRPKFLPWEYTDAPASVWLDASLRITSPRLAVEMVSYADPIAQYVHPWRDCIFTEADASVGIPKYAGEPIMAQAAEYRAAGHPEAWGLWATTAIARRHTEQVRGFGERWLAEVEAWSFQDQVSHPYVLREAGLWPTSLPGDHLTNAWTVFEGSGRH